MNNSSTAESPVRCLPYTSRTLKIITDNENIKLTTFDNLHSDQRIWTDRAYNKKDFTIYLWGKKVKMLGISSAKKAAKLWEEINNKELTTPEKKALEKGFDSKG